MKQLYWFNSIVDLFQMESTDIQVWQPSISRDDTWVISLFSWAEERRKRWVSYLRNGMGWAMHHLCYLSPKLPKYADKCARIGQKRSMGTSVLQTPTIYRRYTLRQGNMFIGTGMCWWMYWREDKVAMPILMGLFLFIGIYITEKSRACIALGMAASRDLKKCWQKNLLSSLFWVYFPLCLSLFAGRVSSLRVSSSGSSDALDFWSRIWKA